MESRYTQKHMFISLILTLLLVLQAMPALAWYPGYAYRPQPYAVPPYQYYPDTRFYPGYYGYAQPRWHVRGRMNRYGDYRVDVKLRDISQYDMYQIWLLYNTYRY